MADYQIQDNVSGKTVTVTGDHAPSQQDAEEIFQKAGLRSNPQPQAPTQPQSDPSQGAFTAPLNNRTVGDALSGGASPLGAAAPLLAPLIKNLPGANTKVYDLPVLGGIARATSEPLAKAAEYGAEAIASPVLDLAQKGKVTSDRRFMSPNDYKAVTGGGVDAALNTLGTGLSAGLSAIGPEAAAEAPGVLKLATKGGVYSKMEEAAKAGADINWNDLADTARAAAKNKTSSVQKALDKLIAEETPTGTGEIPALTSGAPTEVTNAPGLNEPSTYGYNGPLREPTPLSNNTNPLNISDPNLSSSQGLDLRKSLGDRLPSNFFEKLTSKVTPAEQDAINILRRTVSTELKKAAPGIKTPDRLYSLYSRAKGDIPTWATRIILGEALKHAAGNLPGGSILKNIPLP